MRQVLSDRASCEVCGSRANKRVVTSECFGGGSEAYCNEHFSEDLLEISHFNRSKRVVELNWSYIDIAKFYICKRLSQPIELSSNTVFKLEEYKVKKLLDWLKNFWIVNRLIQYESSYHYLSNAMTMISTLQPKSVIDDLKSVKPDDSKEGEAFHIDFQSS